MKISRFSTIVLLLMLFVFGGGNFCTINAFDGWPYWTEEPNDDFSGGKGSKDNPYLISTPKDLAALAYLVSEKGKDFDGDYFQQIQDIVLNELTVNFEAGTYSFNGTPIEWKPIGDYGTIMDDDFEGHYNGAGHSIRGLFMSSNTNGTKYCGLFGSVEDGVIENLTIKDAFINLYDGVEYAGLLAGRGDYHTMKNCHIENSVINIFTTGCTVGGLIGTSQANAWFTSCTSNVHIKGHTFSNNHVGGIIGIATKNRSYVRTLTNCKTTGKISVVGTPTGVEANGIIGGLIGYAYNDEIILNSCVNKIQFVNNTKGFSNLKVGGIVGRSCPNLNMYKCANLGDFIFEGPKGYASLSNVQVGGLMVSVSSSGTLEDCVNYGNFKLNGRIKAAPAYFAGLVLTYGGNYSTVPNMTRCLNIQLANEIRYDLEEEDLNTHNDRYKPGICILEYLSIGYIFNDTEGHDCASNKLEDVHYYVNNAAAIDKGSKWKGTNHSYSEKNSKNYDELISHSKSSYFTATKPFFNNGVWGVLSDVESNRNGYPLPYACGGTVISLPGSGTSSDPYQISSEEELRAVAIGISEKDYGTTESSHFKLTADINMSDEPFTPFGTSSKYFQGTFDGGGHYIYNMHLENGAMFNYANGTIKNLTLLNVVNKGTNGRAAAILNQGSATIQFCYATGTLEAVAQSGDTDTYLAGIACNNTSATEYSYFIGDLRLRYDGTSTSFGNIYVGGITAATLKQNYYCFVQADYTVDDDLLVKLPSAAITYYVGGIVGWDYAVGYDHSDYKSYWLCNGIKQGIGKANNSYPMGPYEIKDESELRTLAKNLGGYYNHYNQGYFHPVLKGGTHIYNVTDPNGNATYIDASAKYDENVILNYTSEDGANLPLMMTPNIAIYSPSSGKESIMNCKLDPDTEFKYTPNAEATEHTGLISYTVKAENNGWHTLCLPCEVKKDDLPDGSKLKICGSYQPTYNSMNVIECDSVPAGVPFIAYIPTTEGDVELFMHGKVVSEPQKADESSSLIGTFKSLAFSAKECNIAGATTLSFDSENHTAKPFTAYAAIEGTGTSGYSFINLKDYILFDESDEFMMSLLIGYTGSTTANVKLYRKMYAGKWNTLCVPFAMTSKQLKATFGNDVVVEKLSSVTYDEATDTYKMTFEDITASGVEAYKPYIIKPSAAGQIYDIPSVSVRGLNNMTLDYYTALTENTVIDDGNTMKLTMVGSPTLNYVESEEDFNAYFLQDDKFYRAVSGTPILSYGLRCWFKASSLSGTHSEIGQATIIHDDGTTTDIRVINGVGTDNMNARIYDLQGRQVKIMKKGLYITNGKKLIKK